MNVLKLSSRFVNVQLKAWLTGVLPFKGTERSREEWDRQYASGDWDRLHKVEELPHYSAIGGYVSHFTPGGSVLDVGCGEGLLQEIIGIDHYSNYVGMDLSEEAIRMAEKRCDDKTQFHAGDAMAYDPEQKFDATVFNEVLYYFDDPKQLLSKYAPFVSDDGVTIISMAYSRRSVRIWKMLDAARTPDADVLVANGGGGWVVKVYKGGLEL